MKKLLGILGSVSLVGTSGIAAVAYSLETDYSLNSSLTDDSFQTGTNWMGLEGGLAKNASSKSTKVVGTSMYKKWSDANPNRTTNITQKEEANGFTYFSPYIDAGMYSGNDLVDLTSKVNNFDHVTLAFVQQVNSHNDYLELSIAGQDVGTAGFDWWEQAEFWTKILQPLAESGNFTNIKTAYGGAYTGGWTWKNPWSLANILNPNDAQKAQADLEAALIGYQESLVDLANRNGYMDVEMPKAIDFDIEGAAQNLDDDNRLLARTLAKMKSEDSEWDFSITLPVMPYGLTTTGYNVMNIFVEEYAAAGLDQSDLPIINLMLMDYGDEIYINARDVEKITNFELAKRAVNATKNNLATSIEANYGTVTIGNEGLYGLIGATPMIGVNDTIHGVYTLEDAKELYNWSQVVGLAYTSMWSVNDDRGRSIWTNQPINKDITCHGLAYLEEYDFSRAFTGDWTEGVKTPRPEWI